MKPTPVFFPLWRISGQGAWWAARHLQGVTQSRTGHWLSSSSSSILLGGEHWRPPGHTASMDVAKMGTAAPPLHPPPQSVWNSKKGYCKVSLGASFACGPHSWGALQTVTSPAPSRTSILARQTPLVSFPRVLGRRKENLLAKSGYSSYSLLPGPFLPAAGPVSGSAWGCLLAVLPEAPSPHEPRSPSLPAALSKMNSSSLSHSQDPELFGHEHEFSNLSSSLQTQYLLLPSSCGSLAFYFHLPGQDLPPFPTDLCLRMLGLGFPFNGFQALENLVCLKTNHTLVNNAKWRSLLSS